MADSNGDGIDDQTGLPIALVASSIQEAKSGSGQASSSNIDDLPLVPLWRFRPDGKAQSSAAADHGITAPGGAAGSAAAADRRIADSPGPLSDPMAPTSQNAAEMYWQDMSMEDRLAFAETAEKAGLWKKSQGADVLFQAWVKSVSLAVKYNYMHKDNKSKWMSPFEAADRMAIAGMADDGLDHDGFSTETTIQQFTVSQLQSQARQILQQELGRNPTDSEMRAYTAAVNAAARANPQQVTQQQTDNPDGSQATDRVVTGGIDPNEIIQDMAGDTDESADFKTAAQYLPALQQAISASIHM